MPEVLLHPSVAERFTRCAPGLSRRGAPDAAHEPAVHRPPGGAAAVSGGSAAAPGAGQAALRPGADRRVSRARGRPARRGAADAGGGAGLPGRRRRADPRRPARRARHRRRVPVRRRDRDRARRPPARRCRSWPATTPGCWPRPRFAGTGLVCGGTDPGPPEPDEPADHARWTAGRACPGWTRPGCARPGWPTARSCWGWPRSCTRPGSAAPSGSATWSPGWSRPARPTRCGCSGRAPAMIRAGGVRGDHRRLRRRAADRGHAARRGAAPAAERPHPAGRHVPDPGRSPARPPDPGAPGPDQPARRRPAAARRDRGLETRPAPAHLPADRAHLRPGRRRPSPRTSPTGCPRRALQAVCDDLLEASIPDQFKDASTSLAVDWTDLESFSRPPPHGTSDCADPEASWGHRKNNLLRSQDELFYGYYLSAGVMMPEENGPAVPELARRATVSSCRHDPVRAFAPVLTAMPGQGIPLGDILDDSGYAHRDAGAWAHPAARRRRRPRPGPAPARPRPQGHPPRRHHRQRQPLLPVHTPPADRTRAAGPHRHQRAGRGPRPQDRRAGPLQARPPHRRRPRRLPPRRRAPPPWARSAARSGPRR